LTVKLCFFTVKLVNLQLNWTGPGPWQVMIYSKAESHYYCFTIDLFTLYQSTFVYWKPSINWSNLHIDWTGPMPRHGRSI
jgi:hypothetical protein